MDSVMKRVGLFVGVTEYDDAGIASLQHAERDAEALYDFFKRRAGYEAKLLLNPDSDELLDVARSMSEGLSIKDLFLFFFAGRSAVWEKEYLLLCPEARCRWLKNFHQCVPLRLLLQETGNPGIDRVLILNTCNPLSLTRANGDDAYSQDFLSHTAEESRNLDAAGLLIVAYTSNIQITPRVGRLEPGLFVRALLNVFKKSLHSRLYGDDRFIAQIREELVALSLPRQCPDTHSIEFAHSGRAPSLLLGHTKEEMAEPLDSHIANSVASHAELLVKVLKEKLALSLPKSLVVQYRALWESECTRGNLDAQVLMAVCYLKGLGGRRDVNKAKLLLEQLSQKHHAMAQFLLAMLIHVKELHGAREGDDVRLLKSAADGGFPLAQGMLGLLTIREVADIDKGRYSDLGGLLLVEQAARAGVVWAQYWLGSYLRVIEEAAEQKLGDAQEVLESYLRVCKEKAPNGQVARYWLEKVAACGFRPASLELKRLEKGRSHCFISSAAGRVLGWADDGPELNLLRHLRDTYMQETPERRAEVEEYYRIAPRIVERIESRPDAEAIWRGVAEAYLVPIHHALRAGDVPLAHRLYRRMVGDLVRSCNIVTVAAESTEGVTGSEVSVSFSAKKVREQEP